MAGTHLVALKGALHAELLAAKVAEELPAGVSVHYSYSRNLGRKGLYLGAARSVQETARFGGAARLERDEQAAVGLHIVVRVPGGSIAQTDAEAQEIGELVEHRLAAAPGFAHEITGVYYSGVDSVDLTPSWDDDAVQTDLSYELMFRSRLR